MECSTNVALVEEVAPAVNGTSSSALLESAAAAAAAAAALKALRCRAGFPPRDGAALKLPIDVARANVRADAYDGLWMVWFR